MPLSPQAEEEALALLTALVRQDSSNPPGRERACAELLADALRPAGYEPLLLEKEPGRTNLVVRRRGDGTGGGPLLLTAHLDVVPADPAGWRHPPFSAAVEDGWLYGRGAVDMKNHAAACAAVMLRLAREGTKLKRDVIFAAVADEEAGCALGSRFLVDEHPDLVRAEWALGEVGGFTLRVGSRRLYPIQVAHRGAAWLTLRAQGTPGHGSIPRENGAIGRLGRAILRIENGRLPVHPTEPVRRMLRAFGAARGFPARLALSLLTRPALADWALDTLVSDPQVRRTFNAVLRNTAVVTVLRAGEAPNALPAVAEAKVDGRLVPGQTPADLMRELSDLLQDEHLSLSLDKEIAAVVSPPDSPLYRQLETSLQEMDPGGVPFPYVAPGFTDGAAFQRLGTRFYGFTPLVLPEQPKVAFSDLFHGTDERVPVEGFKRGLGALWSAVVGFCG